MSYAQNETENRMSPEEVEEKLLHSLEVLKLPPVQEALLFEMLLRYMGADSLEFGYREVSDLIQSSYRSTCEAARELEKRGYVRRFKDKPGTRHIMRPQNILHDVEKAQEKYDPRAIFRAPNAHVSRARALNVQKPLQQNLVHRTSGK